VPHGNDAEALARDLAVAAQFDRMYADALLAGVPSDPEEHMATSISMRVVTLQREMFRLARQRSSHSVLPAAAEGYQVRFRLRTRSPRCTASTAASGSSSAGSAPSGRGPSSTHRTTEPGFRARAAESNRRAWVRRGGVYVWCRYAELR
jgi:hypothetical protein